MDQEILNLSKLIEQFYEDKKQLDIYKKSTEDYNKEIKFFMMDRQISKFETSNGLIAKVTIAKTETFNDDMLLAKLKELGLNEVIKTKEYVDMDLLEDAIYNGRINAGELAGCKVSKEVAKLTVKEKK